MSHKIILNIFHKIGYSLQEFSGTWNRKNIISFDWYINPQTFIMYSNVYEHFQIEKNNLSVTIFFFSYCINEYFLACLLGLKRRHLLFCGKVFILFSMVMCMLDFQDAFSWRNLEETHHHIVGCVLSDYFCHCAHVAV